MILHIVVLNEGVSVSCGIKGAKREVLDKKIKGLSDNSHFLVKFLPERGQATNPSKSSGCEITAPPEELQ